MIGKTSIGILASIGLIAAVTPGAALATGTGSLSLVAPDLDVSAPTAPAVAVAVVKSVAQHVGLIEASDRATKFVQSTRWARKSKASEARLCRSGNDYRRANGSGAFGAYSLTRSQWRRLGGKPFASRPDQASRRSQDLVARRLQSRSGWDALACPTRDWMRKLYSSAPKTPLAGMVIPGTHDSGSSRINVKAPCKPALIAGLPPIFEAAVSVNPCGVAKMARAQDQNLGDQLRSGNRYLDIRVGVPASKVLKPSEKPFPPAVDPLKVPLVLHHNVVSQPLLKGLRQVQKFANNHPMEQVVLDFQHVDLTGDKDVDEYYITALDGMLHQYAPGDTQSVCRSSWSSRKFPIADRKLGTSVPIEEAWRKNRNLLVLFPKSVMPDRSCYRNRDKSIISLWPNTEYPKRSTRDNKEWLSERAAKLSGRSPCQDSNGYWCGLYVSQLQLTMQIETQTDCIFTPKATCSLKYYSQLVNNDIAKKIRKWRLRDGLPMNIVMADFTNVSNPNIADAAIAANWVLINRYLDENTGRG